MTACSRLSLSVCLLLTTAGALAGSADGAGAAETPEARQHRCAVWARELGFAQSVADHDAAAFAEFVHADAVFGVSRQPRRGRETIVADWAPIIDGSAVKLRWYPEVVSISGDGRTAFSSGPALYGNPKDGSYRLGRFGSVWQLDKDGQWRVIFDDGVRPQPVDEAGVKAFNEGRREECPAT